MTPKPTPFEKLATDAAARRARLAQAYLTEAKVQALLGIDSTTLNTWRKGRHLLAVWHAPAKTYLYPDFQFTKDGLIDQIPALLSCFNRYHSHVWENTWQIVEWFMCHYTWLGGKSPIEVLPTDPQRVLERGKEDLHTNPMTMW